jgi:glycosyltransferase involved in cell wall biosynthesis
MSVHIVGDGSKKIQLEQLCSDLGVSTIVQFLGYLDTKEVAREFAAAQIFCGLSRSEALGNVFLEAQAAGCAVIATNVGGIPDIVHHEVDGLLVPSEDVSAAQTALHRLLTDDALRIRLSTSASQGKEVYDWERITERYREIYQNFSCSS